MYTYEEIQKLKIYKDLLKLGFIDIGKPFQKKRLQITLHHKDHIDTIEYLDVKAMFYIKYPYLLRGHTGMVTRRPIRDFLLHDNLDNNINFIETSLKHLLQYYNKKTIFLPKTKLI